jgi:uncharacterized membrane protein YoaK (UPF0700 family)
MSKIIMPTGTTGQPVGIRNMMLAVLAFTSGYIDALSYLALGSVFVSNMTGNTVLLGIAIGRGNGLAALRAAVSLVSYVIGVALGANIVDPTPSPEKIWPHAVTKAIFAEFLVLLMFATGGIFADVTRSQFILYALISLAALAMGLQSTAVHALGVSGIATTYITGTWTRLVSSLTRKRGPRISEGVVKETSQTRIQGMVVVVYILAAILGGLTESNLQLKAAFIPMVGIGLVLIFAKVRMR